MKTRILPAISLILSVLAGCNGNTAQQPLLIEHTQVADSTEYVDMKMSIDLPVATDSISAKIRQDLVMLLDSQFHNLGYGEEEYRPEPYSKADISEINAIAQFYTRQALEHTSAMAAEDYRYRTSWINEDDEMTDQMKQEIIANIPRWEFDINLSLVSDSAGYIVFNSQNYTYLGGAHGGITGSGAVTYSRKDGHRIYTFLKPGIVNEIQPLLIEGLLSYYKDCGESMTPAELLERLFIEDNLVPLPAYAPYPTAQGLTFIYQQYEIASYADGMPSFTIPYDKLQPYMLEF